MNKIVVISIILLLIGVGFLSGCTSEKTYEEKILGEWLRTEPKSQNFSTIYTFFSNGTYATTFWHVNNPNDKKTEYASYKITDKTLALEISSTGKIFIYYYSFSDNYNKFKFVSPDDTSKFSIFVRQN